MFVPVTPGELVEMYPRSDPHPKQVELFGGEDCLCACHHGAMAVVGCCPCASRTTPARPLRVRVCTERVDGPAWLTLLCQCAWLRGGIVGSAGLPAEG